MRGRCSRARRRFLRSRQASGRRRSRGSAVVQVHDTVVEAMLVEQLQLHADVVGEERRASADDDRVEEHVALVDQACRQGVA